MVATDIRQRYAEEIRTNTNVTSAALLRAFASVPREEFVGSGPWKVLSRAPGQMQPQVADVTDPAELYHDVAILLDPRGTQAGKPVPVDRILPSQEFLDHQRVAVASLFQGQ